jgi:malate dehydrogenase (oxaloacetate-decarboxylating)
VAEALRGADVFLGLSAAGLVRPEMLDSMRSDSIVFAMANPTPEIMPEDARGRVAVMATGRSDYPNQINNVLCFPGIFRGAFQVRARQIDEGMKLAAATAIAGVIPDDELRPDYIVPSVFDRRVATSVAAAVAAAAIDSGSARRSADEATLSTADVAF